MWLVVHGNHPSYRALARMGNVYYQQKQWTDAIKYFDKSLTEHRTAEVLKKKQAVSIPVCVLYVSLWNTVCNKNHQVILCLNKTSYFMSK